VRVDLRVGDGYFTGGRQCVGGCGQKSSPLLNLIVVRPEKNRASASPMQDADSAVKLKLNSEQARNYSEQAHNYSEEAHS
jgi:hypothetical protein